LVGWGEECPFSPTYMVAFAEGARAGLHLVARALIGADPRQVEAVYARMDGALHGHAYVKSALDIACWDILGQAAGLPISDLLGGTFQPEFPIYGVVGVNSPERMRERSLELLDQGYRRAQVKVGGDWREDVRRARACLEVLGEAMDVVIVDANAHWRQHEAVSVVAALDDQPIYVEQPCRTLAECLEVRRRSHRPFILDESLTDLEALEQARALGALDAAMLKLSRFGGISRLRQARDMCQRWGLAVTIEDSGGGDVVAAAMAHLSASTRPGALLNGSLINMLVNERIAERAPLPSRGMGRVPGGPGLGIAVDERALGQPAFTVRD
jgi:L-alanine-DL-glutamate epimerase-like enolase superfamily enzyme